MTNDSVSREQPALLFRVGIERTPDARTPLEIRPYPGTCRHGVLQAAVLASATDVAGSLYSREGGVVERAFTTDLSVRVPPVLAPAVIRTSGSILSATRTIVTSELRFEVDGVAIGCGQTTFKRVLAPEGSPLPSPPLPERLNGIQISGSLDAELGIEVLDAARGELLLDAAASIRTPNGALQGTAVAVLVEASAVAASEALAGAARVACELDIRYLAGGRHGPIRTQAFRIARSPDLLRVELRDRGDGDALTAAALVRCEAPPRQ